jgi:4-hydroxybenzoyl-CoA reductase subunit beta
MRLKEFEALQPTTLEETGAFLRKHKDTAVLKAGGTSLIPEMTRGLKSPEYIITLSTVEGLGGIEEAADGLHIGAMAPLHSVKTSDIITKKYPALAAAIETVSAPSMHYQSTLGGNICQNTRCQYYNQSEFWRQNLQTCFKRGGEVCLAAPGAKRCNSVYQGDLAAILICMDAKVNIRSPRKERTIAMEALFTGKGASPLRLKPNELVTEIIIPDPGDNKRFGYEKLRERGSLDYPTLGVAVMLEFKGDLCIGSKFAVTAAGPKPVIISEPFLRSRAVDDGFIEDTCDHMHKRVRPIANLSSTPQHRRSMAKVLVRKVLKGVMV